MDSFDEIGAAICSLSIQPPTACSHDDSDDPMDIDGVEETKLHTEEPVVEEEGSSFLETLNPTELGARYALMPRKLLAATAHTEQDVDHDYEFDLSEGYTTKQQATSLWQPKSPENWQPHGTQIGPGWTSPSLGQSPISSAAPNSNSVQIHHHHYYPNSENTGMTQISHVRRNTVQPYAAQKHSLAPSKASSEVAQAPSTARELSPHSTLPSPWDSAATPTEKTPYILSSYLQLLVNVFLSVYAVHVVVSMIQAIRSDVAHKLEEEANNTLVQIASCERSYRENNCSPHLIVPALEKMCAHWAKCMNQDPYKGGNRSSVSAQTIGILLNSLIEPLSFKFLSVTAFLIVVVFACNFGFGYIRAKTYYGWTNR